MKVIECCAKKDLSFTINILKKEDRDNLDRIGNEIAGKERLHYEGYYLNTTEPYSIEKAEPILFFN